MSIEFFTVNFGGKDGTCPAVRLIEGVRLIWGPLNTGLTVESVVFAMIIK